MAKDKKKAFGNRLQRPRPLKFQTKSKGVARAQQKARDFGSVVQVEFAVGRAAVHLHGLFTDAQILGHLLVAHAVGHHADDFTFALCELVSHVCMDGNRRRRRSVFSDGTIVEADFDEDSFVIRYPDGETVCG